MKRPFLMACCALLCAAAFAQNISTLTVFSEDGHKFFLILNGQRMNDKPETNIRIQNLTKTYYNCKVIFDDKTLGDVSKNYLPVTDPNSPATNMDVTYKIKADKNGKQVLRFFSSQPSPVTATPDIPSDVVVYNFGTTIPVVRTTTTETTTTQNTTGVNTNVNMNGMGINMNVQVNDPNAVQQSTTTTTTTYTTTTTSTPPPPAPAPVVASTCSSPMSNPDYQSAKASINNTGFDETKLKSAKSIISNNCMYANQIADICRIFGFEETKLDFAKFAYKYCYDKKNYFKVNDVFGFDSSKEELSRFTTR